MDKKTLGHQKIEIKKIANESNLLVTFSKRRSGIFKKASELGTLCGAQVCVIVFSPGKKAYSFGHPCVKSVVDRFREQHAVPPPSDDEQHSYIHHDSKLNRLSRELSEVLEKLDMARKESKELRDARVSDEAEYWWPKPVAEMDLEQLERTIASMDEMSKKLEFEKQKLLRSFSLNPLSQFRVGSSSMSADPYDGEKPEFFSPQMLLSDNVNEGEPNAVFGILTQSNQELGIEDQPSLSFGPENQQNLDHEIESNHDIELGHEAPSTDAFGTELDPNDDYASGVKQNDD